MDRQHWAEGGQTHTEQKVWATWTKGRERQRDSFTRCFDSERSWKLKILKAKDFPSSEQPQQLIAARQSSLCVSQAGVQSNGK